MEMELLVHDAPVLSCVTAHRDSAVTLDLVPAASMAACPDCGLPARRVHSRYTRLLDDLPLSGTPTRLRVRVRRFFCDTPACPRRTFVEPLVSIADPHARKTRRLSQGLCRVGLALGGRAGARLAGHLGMGTSGATILRLIRRAANRYDAPRDTNGPNSHGDTSRSLVARRIKSSHCWAAVRSRRSP